ncbi:MAG: hypothetical protein IT349_19360 [Candidatus Eisenbacteria bacterium]|nr:hypothetical protein [Candidatus Eisenbacteria bacterium]
MTDRAVIQGRALDLVDRAIDEVYEKILKPETRKHLSLEDLLRAERVEPQFEYRLEVSYKLRQHFPELKFPLAFWFYSLKGLVDRELVTGALIGGDLMVVEAATREGADTLAAAGLRDTFEMARDLKHNTLLLPEVVQDPLEGLDITAAGRKVKEGPPMHGEMAHKIGRMLSDRSGEQKKRMDSKRFKRRLQ